VSSCTFDLKSIQFIFHTRLIMTKQGSLVAIEIRVISDFALSFTSICRIAQKPSTRLHRQTKRKSKSLFSRQPLLFSSLLIKENENYNLLSSIDDCFLLPPCPFLFVSLAFHTQRLGSFSFLWTEFKVIRAEAWLWSCCRFQRWIIRFVK